MHLTLIWPHILPCPMSLTPYVHYYRHNLWQNRPKVRSIRGVQEWRGGVWQYLESESLPKGGGWKMRQRWRPCSSCLRRENGRQYSASHKSLGNNVWLVVPPCPSVCLSVCLEGTGVAVLREGLPIFWEASWRPHHSLASLSGLQQRTHVFLLCCWPSFSSWS